MAGRSPGRRDPAPTRKRRATSRRLSGCAPQFPDMGPRDKPGED